MNILKVVRLRHIALLWISQVLSSIGDQLYLIAIMWIAVKQVGNSAGIVTIAGSLCALLFGLFGGVFADRWNRRMVMISVDVIRMLAVLSLPLLSLLGSVQVWQLIVVTGIVETLATLFDPSLQASLPMLVKEKGLLQATNGLMDATQRLARILGPGMASILLVLIPLVHFFTLDALSFALSALAITELGTTHFNWKVEQQIQSPTASHSIFNDIVAALQLVRKRRSLVWALLALHIANITWSTSFVVGVPLLTNHVLAGNVGTYGLIVGAYGIGNVVSNLWVGSLTPRYPLRLFFSGKIIFGAGFLLLANAHTLWVALLGSALAAVGGPMGDLPLLTIIQSEFAPAFVGKIYSLRMIISNSGATLGLLFAIPLFNLFSIPLAMSLGPLLTILAGLSGLLRFRKEEAFSAWLAFFFYHSAL